MAKKKKKRKKTKKVKRRKSKNAVRTKKKTRKVKKTRKSKSRKTKSRKRSKPRKKKFKAPKLLEDGDGKSLIKVSDSWANQAYVNKSKYQKKYKLSIKENDSFGPKKEKEFLG